VFNRSIHSTDKKLSGVFVFSYTTSGVGAVVLLDSGVVGQWCCWAVKIVVVVGQWCCWAVLLGSGVVGQ
jgi:hypothetical protein